MRKKNSLRKSRRMPQARGVGPVITPTPTARYKKAPSQRPAKRRIRQSTPRKRLITHALPRPYSVVPAFSTRLSPFDIQDVERQAAAAPDPTKRTRMVRIELEAWILNVLLGAVVLGLAAGLLRGVLG